MEGHMDNGWARSADAWIADMGEHGDFGRRYVLDPVMLPAAKAVAGRRALDIGCGEGRFCRLLKAEGFEVAGLDPTPAFLDAARARDPEGRYVEGVAERLPFADGAFDLVVSYLSLIDIPDVRAAIPEMARVLRPGGMLLAANLNGFNTAAQELGWVRGPDGERRYYAMDRYGDEWSAWIEWRGIRVRNHHRPLSVYMQLFLAQRLSLRCFDEPMPTADAVPAEKAARYRRAPWYCVMEWRKPDVQ
jgi:SAM-dependent methyltransferase